MTATELLRENAALFFGTVGLLGLFVGSFLNVVIHRLPIMMEREWLRDLDALAAERSGSADSGNDPQLPDTSGETTSPTPGASSEPFNLAVPRSRCPGCDAPISAWQNMPIVSWLILRGKCASCAAPISVRYPLVEALTMILSLAVAWRFGPTQAAALGILVTWFLVAMSMIDFDTQLLPDSLTLPLLWIGLLASLLPVFVDTRDAIVGAAAGYLVLWSIYWIFKLVTGKEGMGYGDFKLLAALGALLGWQALPAIILLSSLVGAVVGISLIAMTGRDKSIPIPFGPYLAAAGWIAMLWGPALASFYSNLLL